MAAEERDERGRFKQTRDDVHCLNCSKIISKYSGAIRCSSCRNKYDHPKAGKGTISGKGHKLITVNGKQVGEHRVVWAINNGMKIPKGNVVHHIDNNKLNNKPDNLMLMPNSEHTSLHRAQKSWLGV